MTAAERFAAHVLQTRVADRPPQADEATKIFILDVGIAGSSADDADGLRAVARAWGAQPPAQVCGRSNRLSATAGAFIGAWRMHHPEHDSLHARALVHAPARVLSAALADAAGTI